MKRLQLLVWIGCCVANVLVAQESAGTASAGPEYRVRSFGDERSVPVEEELQAFLTANQGLVASVKREPLDFKTAMARVDALAKKAGGEKALAAVLKALPNDKPETLRLLAVREFARGRLTGVLLLVYAAHKRDSGSVEILSDLAGVLAGLGYPNEALAILAEVDRLGKLPAAPLGIAAESMHAYLRAYCHTRVGEVQEAKKALEKIVEKEPALAEAARLLALVSETDAEKRKNFLLGVWRHRGKISVSDVIEVKDGEPDALTTGEHVGIDLRTVLDLSKGQPGKLPDRPHPKNAAAAYLFQQTLDKRCTEIGRELSAILDKRKKPKGYTHDDGFVEETRGHRLFELLESIDYRDAKVRALAELRHKIETEAAEENRKIERERTAKADEALNQFLREWVAKKIPRQPTMQEMAEVARPFHEEALSRARRVADKREKAERDYFAEWHLLASSVPAQVGDQAWHDCMRLTIEYSRLMAWRRLLWMSVAEAKIGAHPFLAGDPSELPPSPEAQPLQKCDSSKSVGFSTSDFPIGKAMPFEFGVEMNCEGVSVEVGADTRIPGVSISTEIGIDTKGGFTAFVGPKAEVNLGDKEIAAFTASGKAGVYITGNKNEITDAGIKYEAKLGGRIGSYTGAQKVADDVLIRFTPAPVAPSPGGVEPLNIYKG